MEKWLQFIHYTKINLNKIILPKSKLAHVYTTLVFRLKQKESDFLEFEHCTW